MLLKFFHEDLVQTHLDHWKLILGAIVCPSKIFDFFNNSILQNQVERGSCSRHSSVNQDDFKWMYDIAYESTYSQLWFGPKRISKSRICILPNYEQTDSKTAIDIVRPRRPCLQKIGRGGLITGTRCTAQLFLSNQVRDWIYKWSSNS